MSVITADEIAVDLLARYDKMERQLAQADNVVDRRLGNMEARGAAFAGRFTALLGGISVAALSREFLKFADVSKQVEAQLRLATRTFGSFAQAQADVQRISTATRGGLEETAALYGNFNRAVASLGGTQEQASRATETFSKALKLGGADAQQTASATLQFGQALASGALRGDEFNSVAEASPRLLQLIADALGKPRSELRKLAEDGKLTSDSLLRALSDRKFTQGIDDEFKTLPVTFGDAMQQVENAAITTFGAFDRGGQFSTALANFITDGSDGFKGLASQAETTGVDIRATLAGLHDAFNPMLDGARSVFELLGADARSIVEQVRGDISFILSAVDRFSNLGNGIENRARGFLGLGPSAPAADFQGRFDRGFNARQQAGQQAQFRRALGAEGAFNLNKPGGAAVLSLEPTKVDRPAPATGPKKKGPSAETLARRAETERLRGLRNDESFENEKAELQRDLLRARQATATAADTVAQFELQEIETARARQNTSYQRDVSEKKLTQARANELVALNDQLAAARSSAVAAEREDRARTGRALLAQADLANARDLAAAEGDLALTTRVRRDAALRVLDLEYKLERARLEAVAAAETSTDAEKEIARRRLAVLPQLEGNERARIERQEAGPGERYRTDLRAAADDMNTALEGVAVDGLQSLEDGLTGILSGTDSVGDAFKKMADSIISDLIRIAVQRAVIGPLADSLFGAAGASGGGAFGSLLGKIGIGGGTGSLPHLANGGSIAAGGMGGIDRNVLSVNGVPRAMISANERLSVVNPALSMPRNARAAASRSPAVTNVYQISVSADNSVTPAGFARGLATEILTEAKRMDAITAKATLRNVPGVLAQREALNR